MSKYRRNKKCSNCGGPIIWKIRGATKGIKGSGYGFYDENGHSCDEYKKSLRNEKINDILEDNE